MDRFNADRLKVGVCQLRQTCDMEDNVERALGLLAGAFDKGAGICVLPEMFLCPYEPAAITSAAPRSGAALERIRTLAAQRGGYVVAGSLPWPSGEARPFNRSFVIGPDGSIIFHHDKIHLFDCSPPGGPRVVESATVAPGSRLGHFETPWGNASVIVCYDIRFPQLVQLLAHRGVRMLFVPSAFSSSTGEAHWEMLVRIRALELQGFVVGVQPAVNRDLAYVPWGRSVVASPWGEVILRAGEDEAVLIADLDMTAVGAVRDRFPLLDHRRGDLYETRWKGPS
jgi:predicted amidohydrolase